MTASFPKLQSQPPRTKPTRLYSRSSKDVKIMHEISD